jgi:UDP-N-acetylglucosamine 2-epimerase (non-hydrolysing)
VGAYGLVTLHRPQNVDDPATLAGLLDLLAELAGRIPLVFPVHPRTLDVAKRANLAGRLTRDARRLLCVPPLSYLDTLSLLAGASVALTDSGGLQEETSVLRVPCLTLRNTTERPCTVELGTSRLVGNDPEKIRAAFAEVLGGAWPKGADIPLWDGKAGPRVAAALASWLGCPTTLAAPALA